mmetsp:Transcript_25114/g.54338  ORF Transcript_25114/g.54338 Transcript_25114/m.54338 type:complete len:411 (-) Transcript_25114:154-1386(-)
MYLLPHVSVAAVVGSLVVSWLGSLHWHLLQIFLTLALIVLSLALVAGFFMYRLVDEVAIIAKKEAIESHSEKAQRLLIIGSNPVLEFGYAYGSEDSSRLLSSASDSLQSHLEPPHTAVWDPAMLLLGALGFLSSYSEGTMATWIVIFMHRYVCSRLLAVYAYTIFYSCEALGRLTCDSLRARLGRRRLLQLAGGLNVLGIAVLLASAKLKPAQGLGGSVGDTPWVVLGTAYLGTALAGLGCSVLIPTVLSSAGQLPGIHPGTAIAAVSVATNSGSIVGPALTGGMSSALGSLWAALAMLAAVGALVPLLASGVVTEDSAVNGNTGNTGNAGNAGNAGSTGSAGRRPRGDMSGDKHTSGSHSSGSLLGRVNAQAQEEVWQEEASERVMRRFSEADGPVVVVVVVDHLRSRV